MASAETHTSRSTIKESKRHPSKASYYHVGISSEKAKTAKLLAFCQGCEGQPATEPAMAHGALRESKIQDSPSKNA